MRITLLNDAKARQVITARHQSLLAASKGRKRPRIGINELNDCLDVFVVEPFLEAFQDTQAHLGFLLDTALVGTLALEFNAIATAAQSMTNTRVYKRIRTTPPSDVDAALAHYLMSLARTSLNVVVLCMTGADASARPLLRVFLEGAWTFGAISSEQATYDAYWEWHRTQDETIWWREFRWKELMKKLAKFEARVKLPPKVTTGLTDFRTDLYKYYSEAVHLSPLASVASNFSTSFSVEKPNLRLLLGASAGSARLLKDLVVGQFYLLVMQRACLQDIHKFKPNLAKRWWNEYQCCYDYFAGLFEDILFSDDNLF